MADPKKVAAVVGVGPGLGRALSKRFAEGGFEVALMARQKESLEPVRAEIEASGKRAKSYPCDASEEASVKAAFQRVREEMGAPEVLLYNAGAFVMGGILDLGPSTVEMAWRIGCLGALVAAQAVLPAMIERGRGTVILTGATASMRGSAGFAGLAIGKFGLRALAQSMARELGPKGVHVAHVVIDGQIDTPLARSRMPGRDPSTLLAPEAIAEVYFGLHQQHPTAWTQEIDLRPASEKF
jgi:NAD(P)-dependent dehydrogenase (short-subunit alcohol dehydrogenase family)